MTVWFRVFKCDQCGHRQYRMTGTDVNQEMWCGDCFGLRMHIYEGIEEA